MFPRMTWCDTCSLSCRNESKLEYLQADSTISTNRPRLWMCVCARVLTPLHEDEIWMIQMKAFLSLVPLNVGPASSREGLTRHWALYLFAVGQHHFLSKMSCPKDCTKKGTFQDVTVDTIVVVVDDQPVLT